MTTLKGMRCVAVTNQQEQLVILYLVRAEVSQEKRVDYQLTNCIFPHFQRFLIDQAELLRSHTCFGHLNDPPISLNHKDKKMALLCFRLYLEYLL